MKKRISILDNRCLPLRFEKQPSAINRESDKPLLDGYEIPAR